MQQLLKEYPDQYKDLIPYQIRSRKRDLELEIQEPAERHLIGKSIPRSKPTQTSSTKNSESENSIFNIIERAKAKSNGTTPQHCVTLTPSNNSESTPASKKVHRAIPSIIDLGEEINLTSISKKNREFVSPMSLDKGSPNGIQYIQKKKKTFSFISTVFGKQNPQSPARVPLAKKFLEEKLGQETVEKIQALYIQDPKNYLVGVKELLAPDQRHILPVIEYVFTENKTGMKVSLSPISAQTGSTAVKTVDNAEKDKMLMTFGNFK